MATVGELCMSVFSFTCNLIKPHLTPHMGAEATAMPGC